MMEANAISAVHEDIMKTHVLTRLDGPSLVSAACASSQLNALISTDDDIWRKICVSNWPSINNPRVSHVISTFPFGHRSFFSDSFPVLDHRRTQQHDQSSTIFTTELISCVDMFYKDEVILSKTREIETTTGWFLCSPFRVDLLDPKETVRTPLVNGDVEDDTWLEELEENLKLSWVLIDPERKRCVDMSSRKATSVERHWLSGDVQARFSLVVDEAVKLEVVVTCRGCGDEVQVREVSMQVEDMNGKGLTGRDSLVILQDALENNRRKKWCPNEVKTRHDEFLQRKRDVKLRRVKREQALDLACIVVGVTSFVTFWCLFLFR